MKRRKLAMGFAGMRADIKRAEDCFAGIRILCDALLSMPAGSAWGPQV